MLYYIRNYPFSCVVLLAVVYLSFFNPPSFAVPRFPHFDKVGHFCMYAGLSGMLWVEYLWNHRREKPGFRKGFLGATLLPVVFGGLVEIGQECLTADRQGDILDFAANTSGVLLATLITWFLLKPLIIKN